MPSDKAEIIFLFEYVFDVRGFVSGRGFKVRRMKFNTRNLLSVQFPTPFNGNRSSNAAEFADPADLAVEIRERHPETLHALNAVMHHPRSLSRPTASWRPPVLTLPRIANGPQLSAAITRRRVGPRARERIQGYGQTQVPAYLVEVRLSDSSGMPADTHLTEAWIRALVPEDAANAVHELPGARTVSYVWLVDGTFTPIESPSSMFEGLTAA